MNIGILLVISLCVLILQTLLSITNLYFLLRRDKKEKVKTFTTSHKTEEMLLNSLFERAQKEGLDVDINSRDGRLCLVENKEDGSFEKILEIVFPLGGPETNEYMKCLEDQMEKLEAYIKEKHKNV